MLASGWKDNVILVFQMKALLLNTIRSICCQWPIEAKIQMDHSFSCKYRVSSWMFIALIYGICMAVQNKFLLTLVVMFQNNKTFSTSGWVSAT